MKSKNYILQAVENLKEEDQDKKYNLDKETLNKSNELLKKGYATDEDIRKLAKKQREKEYDKVWELFKQDPYASHFKSYTGYGVEEIEQIGVEKFLKFVDWSIENVKNYQWTRDAIKTLICGECKNEFTTFQLDYGLCEKCKSKFDIRRFEKSLESLESKNPGSSEQEIILFTFFKEYRECYKILNSDEIIQTIKNGNFVYPNAIFLILECLKDNKTDLINKILDDLLSYINESPESRQWHHKLYSLIKENKVDKIIELFL